MVDFVFWLVEGAFRWSILACAGFVVYMLGSLVLLGLKRPKPAPKSPAQPTQQQVRVPVPPAPPVSAPASSSGTTSHNPWAPPVWLADSQMWEKVLSKADDLLQSVKVTAEGEKVRVAGRVARIVERPVGLVFELNDRTGNEKVSAWFPQITPEDLVGLPQQGQILCVGGVVKNGKKGKGIVATEFYDPALA